MRAGRTLALAPHGGHSGDFRRSEYPIGLVSASSQSTAFPHLDEYLRCLPEGYHSYPECRAKGILVRSAIEGHRPRSSWATLPSALRSVLERPPLPTVWVPAVIADAVFYVICDSYYPSAEAVLQWNYDRTARLAKTPVYVVLRRALGPEVFLRGAVRIHAMFQQGTHVKLDIGRGRVRIRLSHPPYLHMGFNHLSNVAVMRAILEAAGGKAVRGEMLASEPTFAEYEHSWVV
jgi:hypothetical protein